MLTSVPAFKHITDNLSISQIIWPQTQIFQHASFLCIIIITIDTDGVIIASVKPINLLPTFPSFLALLLPSQNVDHKLKLRSKKGQLPFVEVNGEEIADSAIIIKELAQRYEKDLDAALTQEQRNIAHAMISMLENHLIWVLLFWRSKNPDQMIKGYKVNLQHALGSRLPNAVLNFLFKFQFGRKVNCIRVLTRHSTIYRELHVIPSPCTPPP